MYKNMQKSILRGDGCNQIKASNSCSPASTTGTPKTEQPLNIDTVLDGQQFGREASCENTFKGGYP